MYTSQNMTRCLLSLFTLPLLALLAGCTQAPQASQSPDTHDADVAALKTTEAQWNKEYEAKDLEKLVAHYTDDAVLMTPFQPAVSGKDAIRAALKGLVSDPAFTLKFQASHADAARSGDVAFTQGSYALTVTDPSTKKVVNDKGSYVTVYKKQADGGWKAVSDIASSEVSPGPPPEKK